MGGYEIYPVLREGGGIALLAGGGPHLSLHKSTGQIVTPTSRSTICPASFISGWMPCPLGSALRIHQRLFPTSYSIQEGGSVPVEESTTLVHYCLMW